MALEHEIFNVLNSINDDGRLMNKVVVAILSDQVRILQGVCDKYGPRMPEECRTLEALKIVIAYNTIEQQKV